jgi:DNA-binding Lrp family transcriptional regulator
MPTKAFILIEVQVGRANNVADSLRSLQEVTSAEVVTGPYDIIASIQVSDMAAMADLVTSQMQSIRGVIKTITCVTAG